MRRVGKEAGGKFGRNQWTSSPVKRFPDGPSQFCSGKHVRIVGTREGLLQFLQLEGREGGSVSSLLPHLGNTVLVPHLSDANLGSRIRTWRSTRRSWTKKIGRVSTRVVMAIVMVMIMIVMINYFLLELVPGWRCSVTQTHNIRD